MESKRKSSHPDWVLAHRKENTEIKLINGKYYLYGVKSVYDKGLKRAKKVSLGVLGRITQNEGFVPSQKRELEKKLEEKSHESPHKTAETHPVEKKVIAKEYGLSKWLVESMKEDGALDKLKEHFPSLWQFVVAMIYTRIGYQSALKRVEFHLEESDLKNILGWDQKLSDQKISDMLFELGSSTQAIHDYLRPEDNESRTVLMDATDISLQSKNISLSQKGYNSAMNFESQFVLLYIYDANSFKPVYYRLLPGNIREISAMKNTIKMSGLKNCVFVSDKGFFSEKNIEDLEDMGMQYIIPLRRNNSAIDYNELENIELTEGYFEHEKRFIFHTKTKKIENRNLNLFLDGKLREQEKNDYLKRINTLPEKFSKEGFNEKFSSMGTLAILHNTSLNATDVYLEYKTRGQIEQFFDHLKNTLDASSSNMQREESLNGWMFINHLSMQFIYQIHEKLRTTPLNKTQMLNHKYSLQDTLEHLKSIKKIQFSLSEYTLGEQNKLTKTLLEKLKIHIT
jgi:transposase